MATFDVYNLDKQKVGSIDLSDNVFATEVNENLIYEVAKMQQINRRRGTVGVKNRSLVSGGGRKPWKQKGTGRARQGSSRAPHRPGGGNAHALEPKDWSYRPPRKVRIGALKSALSLFAKEDRLIIVDSLELAEFKTKAFAGTLDTLKADKKALVVDTAGNEKLVKSIRNLEKHHFLPPEGVNVYDLLRHDHLVVSKEAAKALEARCLRTSGDAAGNG
jgi:large subunit ribosomal protein L4